MVTIDRFLKDVNIPGVIVNNEEVSENTAKILADKNFDFIIYVGYKTELIHLLDRETGFDKGTQLSNTGEKVKFSASLIQEESIRS